MRIVLDTNVLISGLLTPNGKSAEILRGVLDGRLQLCIDERIISEYREVASREEFQIAPEGREVLLRHLEEVGVRVCAGVLPKPLPDESDEPFLAVAVSAAADHLVTGNLKHFPKSKRCGISVVSPAEFVEILRRRP